MNLHTILQYNKQLEELMIFFKHIITFYNLTHHWDMKGSDNSSYSHARRGRGLSHNCLHLGRSATRSFRWCRNHFIAIGQGQCDPHTSCNGTTGVIYFIAQRDAGQYVCVIINFLNSKEHRHGKLEISEIQTSCKQFKEFMLQPMYFKIKSIFIYFNEIFGSGLILTHSF